MTEMFEALLKVVVIGDTAVGKTCLILRYTQDLFRENFLSTIGEKSHDQSGRCNVGRGSLWILLHITRCFAVE